MKIMASYSVYLFCEFKSEVDFSNEIKGMGFTVNSAEKNKEIRYLIEDFKNNSDLSGY